MKEYRKPLPRITPDNRPFWEAARRHELCLPRCLECRTVWYPLGPVCPECLSERFEWERMSGRGKVSSWVVFHQRYFESFASDIPYNVVQVELEEGPRLMTNLVDCDPASIHCDMAVEVVFEDVTDEISLPKFRPIRSSTNPG